RRLLQRQHAGLLARRRAQLARELWEVVGGVQGLERRLPTTSLDQVVPVRDHVVQGAASLAEGHAAVHAPACLLLGEAGIDRGANVAVIAQSLIGGPVWRDPAADLEECAGVGHATRSSTAAGSRTPTRRRSWGMTLPKRSASAAPCDSRSDAIGLAVSSACCSSSEVRSATSCSSTIRSTSTIATLQRPWKLPSSSSTNAMPPDMPAAKLRPVAPSTATTPPVMYSQPWSPTPSTTAAAPELRTQKRSPACPRKKARPPVAPYSTVLPTTTPCSAGSPAPSGGRMTSVPPDRPLPA